MRTGTEHQQYDPVVSADEQLAPMATRILGVRAAFLDHLNTLPAPFREPAKRHYLDRLVRAEGRHMLGEYAPFLLADVLGIPGEVASALAVPWLVLYEHALLVDDMIDVKDASWAGDILLSQLLFDDFVSMWRERFSERPGLWEVFSKYHLESLASSLEQLERSADAVTPRPQHAEWDYSLHLCMGRKAALVKFCGAALNVAHRDRVLSRDEDDGIDMLCAGIQLLDDLSDYMEDYRGRRITFPLQAAFSEFGRQGELGGEGASHAAGEDELAAILVLSGTPTRIATLVRHYLLGGLAALTGSTDSPTGRYLLSLAENISRVAASIEELFDTSPREIETMLHSLRQGGESWRRLLADPVYGCVWSAMKSRFKNVPSASN